MIAPDDLAACRASLANGSRTFLAASWLLPRSVRDPACALYAFCRLADDLVDGADPANEVPGVAADDGATVAATSTMARTTDAVNALSARLDAIYAGTPIDCAADRALASVVRDHGIARVLPDALIEGFAWDAEGRRFETIEDLHAYAARVAGAVGAMMALLMGVRGPAELARACDLGVAMQLSNIARDVGADARMGRIYLPLAWLRDEGIDPDAWVAAPTHGPELARVVQRLLDEADRLYARVGRGIARLPVACRPGINVARRLYAAIGHEVARRGHDAVSARAVVPASRKARLAFGAMLGALAAARWSSRGPHEPPLAATAFLVDAAADRAWRPLDATRRARWNLAAHAIWTIELFERLERRDRHAIARHWSPPASASTSLSA